MKKGFYKMNTWEQRLNESIAQESLTNSKAPKMGILGVTPTIIKRSSGAMFEDIYGKTYIDYTSGLGANLFGYGNERIAKALEKHLREGFSNSLATVHEIECAELLKELFPFVERFKFRKTGGDACVSALKFARNYTGRTRILSQDYHGDSDHFVSLTPPHSGITDDFDIWKLEDDLIDNKVAAIIIEPVQIDNSDKRIEWLKELRSKCNRLGILLIYDEVITGFRYRKHSVSMDTGIKPDIIILAKAMANGLPLSAIGFKNKEICEDFTVFCSSTFAGETLSLISCKEVCKMLLDGSSDINVLWNSGNSFFEGFNQLSKGIVNIKHYCSRGSVEGYPENKALVMQEMAKSGLFMGQSPMYNFAHIPYNFVVLNSLQSIFEKIRLGAVKLEGPLPESPFSQNVRNEKN
jgi:glutamate-1-semialdehyde 2,1-aminomutase